MNAATPPQTTPPAAAPKPAPKSAARKSGGVVRAVRRFAVFLLLAAVLLAGGGYYAYQQPALRPYVKKIIALSPPAARLLREKQTAAAPTTAAPKNTLPKENAPLENAPDNAPDIAAAREVSPAPAQQNTAPKNIIIPIDTPDSFSQNNENGGVAAAARAEELIARLAAAEQTAAKLLRAWQTSRRAAADMQLQMIDLRLRQSGAPAAAAAALSPLQKNADIDQAWLSGEIARLQKMPPKKQIAETIRKLARLENAARTQKSAAPPVLDGLMEVLRSRHGGAPSDGRLQTLELLWLTGRRETYAAALADIVQHPPAGADPNIVLLVDDLQKFGAPHYALNYGDLP
ncbi:MAG: hypothetical protein HAW59_04345 [Betaproteobacteria bacterium]|nr:hypothetical protein [Betaproteobacteria bacterium]